MKDGRGDVQCKFCKWLKKLDEDNYCVAHSPVVLALPMGGALGQPTLNLRTQWPSVDEDWYCSKFERRIEMVQ